MSVKKILSIIMALAMVLTMASFPAFAEGTAVAIVGVTGTTSSDNASRAIANAYDGDNTTYFTSDQYGNNFSLVFELAESITLDTLKIEWGGTSGWDRNAPKGYDVYVSVDGSTWGDAILTYTGLHSKATAAETYPGYTYVGGGTDNAMRYDMVETDLNVENVKYIRIRMTSCNARTSMREITVLKAEEAAKVPTTYTVKYTSDDPDFVAPEDKVVSENVFVGDEITEDAPEIDGYLPDEPSKSITLVEGTNEIKFTYRKGKTVNYTVKYVDEAGKAIANEETLEGEEGQEITVTALNLFAQGYFIAEDTQTVELVDGTNEIEFVYTKVIKATSHQINKLNGAGGWVPNSIGTEKNVYNGKIGTSTGVYQVDGSSASTNPVMEFVFGFDKAYAFDTLTVYATDVTRAYIYVSDDGETWGEAVYDGTPETTTISGVKAAAIDLNGAAGQYIKYVIHNKKYFQIHEFTFEGGEPAPSVDLTGKLKSEGAGIRLPNEELGIMPGIRFGATINKEAFGIDTYDPDGDVQFGMFLILSDRLVETTFVEYLEANNYAEGDGVVYVPARKILKDEDGVITYTAVVHGFTTAEDFETEITAVPYVCYDGNYAFADEIENKTYLGVVNDAIEEAEGENKFGLSEEDIDALKEIRDSVSA